ncbi:MAG: methyl-accepting chemotaxis protein, partial [Proteobacteria bacterium]|nr:methyl-accepting chemotaxis protein [Pseudomonadota bacterium]
SEVRALAQRSAEAAKEIKKLITASSGQVEQGVSLVRRTGQTLASIVEKVTEIDALVSEISASAREQAEGLDQVNIAVNEMDKVVQQNAAMVEQSTAATHSLRAETLQVSSLIAHFRTGGEASPAPAPTLEPARARAATRTPLAPPARAPVPAASPVHAMTRRLATAVGARGDDGWEEF